MLPMYFTLEENKVIYHRKIKKSTKSKWLPYLSQGKCDLLKVLYGVRKSDKMIHGNIDTEQLKNISIGKSFKEQNQVIKLKFN